MEEERGEKSEVDLIAKPRSGTSEVALVPVKELVKASPLHSFASQTLYCVVSGV